MSIQHVNYDTVLDFDLWLVVAGASVDVVDQAYHELLFVFL